MPNVLLSPIDVESEFARRLQANGARLITWPELSEGPPETFGPVDEAIENLFGYDWMILKNARAAESFLKRVRDLNQDILALDELRVCVIGEPTAEALREYQVHVDLPVERFAVDGVFAAMSSYLGGSNFVSGLNVLVPCANITRETFVDQLEAHGARVDAVDAYLTTDDPRRIAQLKGLLVGGGIDCVLFTHASAIEGLADIFDTENLAGLFAGVPVACLDPQTTGAAIQFGLISAVSPPHASALAIVKLVSEIVRS